MIHKCTDPLITVSLSGYPLTSFATTTPISRVFAHRMRSRRCGVVFDFFLIVVILFMLVLLLLLLLFSSLLFLVDCSFFQMLFKIIIILFSIIHFFCNSFYDMQFHLIINFIFFTHSPTTSNIPTHL